MKNDHITKALFVVLFLIVSFVGSTQCGRKYNSTKFKDPARDYEWVYGKEDKK
ncbi:MAG: hypothetical protein SNJ77_11460 [Cytophagales bacterium]